MSETIVVVENLTRRFGDFTAVDSISFEVRKGEVFGFLGPNGAGKTTTIKVLTGLQLPSSGRARVAGFDVATESEEIKSRVGYMSQLFSLYGDLTVEENIAFFSGLYSVPRAKRPERRDWVLEMAGLESSRGRLVRELSLGWKQRLALGCAVLHEPPVLFLDEPTSGVDPLSRRAFWDLIYRMASGGTTVFVTTHYMEEAEYCDRLALMNRGRLVALDTPAAIRARLDSPILEIDLGEPLRGLDLIERSPEVDRAALYGRAVHAVVHEQASAESAIRSLLGREGIAVHSIRRIEPSLEDVFVALIESSGGAIDG